MSEMAAERRSQFQQWQPAPFMAFGNAPGNLFVNEFIRGLTRQNPLPLVTTYPEGSAPAMPMPIAITP